VATSALGICPKCKGYLMLEKDDYGLYQQCLQCGYTHDLTTVGRVHKKHAEQKTEVQAKQRVTSEVADWKAKPIPRLEGYSETEYLTFPSSLQAILNELLEERQNILRQK
jgi:DNA-directed RNA polymerase subunit M/transcription elongation factor TFIIS